MKTNVTRMLESQNIPFKTVVYEVDEEDLSGLHAAQFLGVPPEQMFKTLVVKGERRGYFVCCIPCCEELDLKRRPVLPEIKRRI